MIRLKGRNHDTFMNNYIQEVQLKILWWKTKYLGIWEREVHVRALASLRRQMIRLHLLGFIFDPFHIMETNDSFLSFACCLFSITLFPHVNTNVLNNVVNPLGWIFSNLETIQWDWLCGWTSLRQWTIGCLTKLSLCIMNLVLWLITKNLPCVSCLDLEAIIVTYMLSMANNRQPIGLRMSKLNGLKTLKLEPIIETRNC